MVMMYLFTEVVMTPLKGSHKDLKIIKVERLPWKKLDEGNVQHIAGGPYKGIIVNRAVVGQYIQYNHGNISIKRASQ